MSHSAGLNIPTFPGYAASDAVPTVPEILGGHEPANTDPVQVGWLPGMTFTFVITFMILHHLRNTVVETMALSQQEPGRVILEEEPPSNIRFWLSTQRGSSGKLLRNIFTTR